MVVTGMVMALALGGQTTPARAAPATPAFGPAIEALQSYEGQYQCTPTPKPGTLALQALLAKAYPSIGSLGISRACDIGDQSEHKEGRAYDWAARSDNATMRSQGIDFLTWLFASDQYGHPYAMARRLGIMYIIWDRHIWRAYNPTPTADPLTWGTYNGPDPHVSHMHISLSWAGAYEQTTWWNPQGAAAPALGKGYWIAFTNGVALPEGAAPAPAEGDLAGTAVGMAARADGKGFWVVSNVGDVSPHGNADPLGDVSGVPLNRPVVGMAATPTGKGYWLVASDGGIFSFGDAVFLGSTGGIALNKPIVGMAATPTGKGYWLVASDGGIFTFGDAGFFGSTGAVKLNKPVVGMGAVKGGKGYWLVASDGGIFTFGTATFFGSTGAVKLNRPIIGMSPTSTSKGYRLVASDGGVFTFGDAAFTGSGATTGITAAGIASYG